MTHLPDIQVAHLQRMKLADPHSRSKKNQNEGPVPDVTNNGEKLPHIAGVNGSREQIRQL